MTQAQSVIHPATSLPLGALAAASVFLLTVAAKVVDPQAVMVVLQDTWGLPRAATLPVAAGLVAVEVALLSGLLLKPRHWATSASVVAFLFVVSVSPVAQLLQQSQHGCGCGFGGFLPSQVEQVAAVARNLLLILLLAPALKAHSFNRDLPASSPS